MMWFDSHCHLQRFSSRGELEDVIDQAKKNAVVKMTTVGTSKDDWDLYHDISQKYRSEILYTVGLHPSYVDKNWQEQVERIALYWNKDVAPNALGEIGLDYFRLSKNQDQNMEIIRNQKQAFEAQLQIAANLEVPVVIHSRSAMDDCVEMIDRSDLSWTSVVFHCFSGTMDQMIQIQNRGGWVSFTGILSYKSNHELRKVFQACKLDRLMIETDSPYLAPVPKRGQENVPAYLAYLGSMAAKIVGLEELDFAKKLFDNTEEFYGCQS